MRAVRSDAGSDAVDSASEAIPEFICLYLDRATLGAANLVPFGEEAEQLADVDKCGLLVVDFDFEAVFCDLDASIESARGIA
jgi:hypothetical protein